MIGILITQPVTDIVSRNKFFRYLDHNPPRIRSIALKYGNLGLVTDTLEVIRITFDERGSGLDEAATCNSISIRSHNTIEDPECSLAKAQSQIVLKFNKALKYEEIEITGKLFDVEGNQSSIHEKYLNNIVSPISIKYGYTDAEHYYSEAVALQDHWGSLPTNGTILSVSLTNISKDIRLSDIELHIQHPFKPKKELICISRKEKSDVSRGYSGVQCKDRSATLIDSRNHPIDQLNPGDRASIHILIQPDSESSNILYDLRTQSSVLGSFRAYGPDRRLDGHAWALANNPRFSTNPYSLNDAV